MTYIKIIHSNIFKDNIIIIEDYIYDSSFNKTDISFYNARLSEIVKSFYVKSIHGHYFLLSNVRPIVEISELRKLKLKKFLQNVRS